MVALCSGDFAISASSIIFAALGLISPSAMSEMISLGSAVAYLSICRFGFDLGACLGENGRQSSASFLRSGLSCAFGISGAVAFLDCGTGQQDLWFDPWPWPCSVG